MFSICLLLFIVGCSLVLQRHAYCSLMSWTQLQSLAVAVSVMVEVQRTESLISFSLRWMA